MGQGRSPPTTPDGPARRKGAPHEHGQHPGAEGLPLLRPGKPADSRTLLVVLHPLGGAIQTTPPPQRSADADLPPLPWDKPTLSRTPLYTGIILVSLCVLLGLVTYGFGLLLLLPLTPALVRLFRASTESGSAVDGCISLVAAIGVALLVAVSFTITFVAFCAPIGFIAFVQSFENPNPPTSATFIALAAWGLGLLAAGFVAYWLVRRFWPRGGRR